MTHRLRLTKTSTGARNSDGMAAGRIAEAGSTHQRVIPWVRRELDGMSYLVHWPEIRISDNANLISPRYIRSEGKKGIDMTRAIQIKSDGATE